MLILFPNQASYDHFYGTADHVLQGQQDQQDQQDQHDQNGRNYWRTELEYKRRVGSRFPAEVTLAVLNQPGHERYLVSVVRDISRDLSGKIRVIGEKEAQRGR